jgi:hypothetical protein
MTQETCSACGVPLLALPPKPKANIVFIIDYPGPKELRRGMNSEAGMAFARELSLAKFPPMEYNTQFFIGHAPNKGKGKSARVITTDACWAAASERLRTIIKMYTHVMLIGNDMCRSLWPDVKADEWYGLQLPKPEWFKGKTLMVIPSLRELTASTIGEFRLGMEKFHRSIYG